jgi:hypothetical protein
MKRYCHWWYHSVYLLIKLGFSEAKGLKPRCEDLKVGHINKVSQRKRGRMAAKRWNDIATDDITQFIPIIKLVSRKPKVWSQGVKNWKLRIKTKLAREQGEWRQSDETISLSMVSLSFSNLKTSFLNNIRHHVITTLSQLRLSIFCGLQCVGHSFAIVAHFVFL